jgi:hypothetical protein
MMFKKILLMSGLCGAFLIAGATQALAFDLDFRTAGVEYLDSGLTRLSFTWNSTGAGMQPSTFIAVESAYMVEREPNGQFNYLSAGSVTRRDFYGYQYQLHVYLRNYRNGRGAWYASNWITCKYFLPPQNRPVPVWLFSDLNHTVSTASAIELDWTVDSYARIYEVQAARTSDFNEIVDQFWPSASHETITGFGRGMYYFRIRSWNTIPGRPGALVSDWSAVLSVQLGDLSAPVLAPLESVTQWETTRLDWSDVPGASIYQVVEYYDLNGNEPTGRQFWPNASFEPVRHMSAGERFYQVRAWSAPPENGGISSAFSDPVGALVLAIPGAEITAPDSVAFNEAAFIDWNDVAGASIYQLMEYRDQDCVEPTGRQFWPSASHETLTYDRPGTYFYRVRAWNESPSQWSPTVTCMALPDQPVLVVPSNPVHTEPFTLAWVDGNTLDAVEYSVHGARIENGSIVETFMLAEGITEKSKIITITEAGDYALSVSARGIGQSTEPVFSDSEPLTVFDDAALLNDIQRSAFDYFIDTTFSDTGLARDKFPRDRAATVERIGAEEFDTVSTAACGFYLSVLTVGVENGWISDSEARTRAQRTLETFRDVTPNYYGFFYHYLQPDGSPSEYPIYEVSTIDTALFLAGALQAGEYFGGDIQDMAEELYRRVQWTKLFNGYTNLFHMGWRPSDGAFGEYDAYSESILLYLLAIASPTDPIAPETFYNFMRDRAAYNDGEKFVYNFFGQLFTYQFPHAWFDFENKTDALGVDWYENSRHAVRANREYCRDQGYEENYWGISAALADPDKYPSGYAPFGALPADVHTADGTIAPYAVIASLAFEPESALAGIQYLAYGMRDAVWGEYGFADSLNSQSSWSADAYLGIDQGIICLMLENLKARTVWDSFMRSEHALRALERTRFSGFGPPIEIAEGFEAATFWNSENTLGWWAIDGDYVYQFSHEYKRTHSGEQSLRVHYNKHDRSWSLFAGYIAPENPLRDMTRKTKLYFWVSGEVELLVKLRDRTFAEVELGTVKTTTPDAWSYVEFDLAGVSGINKADVDTIMFFAQPGQQEKSGSFVIDTIVLE